MTTYRKNKLYESTDHIVINFICKDVCGTIDHFIFYSVG